MYSNERNSGFNWKDIISKIIFLALFVLLLMWLFPKVPNMIPFYNNVFRENIKYMQDAAKSHFTTDKLPQNVGETVELKLQDMIAQKLIIPFVDKDGNSCNVYKSYVSVTKNLNDYTFKVNLSCNEEEDYIEETLGCYNYCENDICTKQVEEEVEYQFKKCSTKSATSCECPSGFVLSGNKCLKTTSNSVSAIPVFSTNSQKVYDASIKEGETKKVYVDYIYHSGGTTYSCPSGYNPSSDQKSCTKTTNSNYTSGVTTYSCPSGYNPSSDQKSCTRTVSSSSSKSCTVVKTRGTYSGSAYDFIKSQFEYTCSNHIECPNQVLYNYYNKCTISYSCSSGYNISSDKKTCSRTIDATSSTSSSNYSCSEGYDISSDKKTCSRTIDANITTTNPSYTCPSGSTPVGSGSSLKCYITRKDSDTYYCKESGDMLVNKKCYHFVGGEFLYYKCPSGYNLSGTYCYVTSDETAEKVCNNSSKNVCSYKWSKSTTMNGWTSTGKTRTVKK